jgi:hypothetical protein
MATITAVSVNQGNFVTHCNGPGGARVDADPTAVAARFIDNNHRIFTSSHFDKRWSWRYN